LIALLICAVGDLIAGIILGKMTFFLETFPGLLVVIPGAIGMRGNIFGSFASRLSTSLHIGLISPEFEFSEDLNNNIFSSFVLTLVLSIFLGIVAILPAFAQIAGVNQQFAQFYGGTSLLILVGVVLDTLQQIESHLLMRHYDGLMKTGRIKGKTPGGPAAY
jgi:cation transporter-like permease